MNQATQPYLHFDGKCREAMEFYKQLFGGELDMMIVKESPMKDHFPKEVQDEVLHSSLRNGDFSIMASDMCGMGELKQGNNVEISLNCTSEEEINHLYKELPEGGKILDELKEQFWGALFAMVQDRFGVRWMLSLEKR
jgi:PhnB protein